MVTGGAGFHVASSSSSSSSAGWFRGHGSAANVAVALAVWWVVAMSQRVACDMPYRAAEDGGGARSGLRTKRLEVLDG